ncbi:MAG: ComEC family competence protein [Chitinophagaceae bacterium]|nr:MAG: ComEC family competence protein [Chitinophagaceae bacterium]
MRVNTLPAWKHRPALRLLLPFSAGILLQWYAALPLWALASTAATALLVLLVFRLFPLRWRFTAAFIQGIALHLLLLAAGACCCRQADVRNDPAWLGHGAPTTAFIAEVTSEPVEKPASYKVQAKLLQCQRSGSWQTVNGNVQLYVSKGAPRVEPGQFIQVTAPLQAIRRSGNPGAFDYARWSLFQGVTHQAYVRQYEVLAGHANHPLNEMLARLRQFVLHSLRSNIPGKEAQGLAEALLIGYKNDLDAELAATYARTGVVHIIAISGMHLALVYVLLMGLTIPLGAPRLRLLRLALVLGGLWGFSLLAGGGPSVLRSAVMFSFLAVGGLLGRKGDSLNSLLLAALSLLVINPFWLWDIGFQLSFTAVGGIILFYRPIYSLYLTHNKALDFIWKGAAVSLAAQVLTTPLSLYHFHQFPLLFLAANLLAVPLSGLLVYALIALCGLWWWPAAAALVGKACAWMIALLNGWIERIDRVPFALWEGISISVVQTVLLYGLIAAIAWALLRQRPKAMRWAALCLLLFTALRSYSFADASRQQRLVVYQVPKFSVLEVYDGRTCFFRGDAHALQQPSLYNFHLRPAHTLARKKGPGSSLPNAFRFGDKTVAHIGWADEAEIPDIPIDLLIIARHAVPDASILEGARSVVLDASVSRRNASKWKDLCAQLNIHVHDVQESGAFVWER